MKTQKLTLTIHSDWHIGSGEEGGAYADALVLRSAQGLPYLPGKSLKGLVKEAFTVAMENNWFSMANGDLDLMALLFGQEGEALGTHGALHFSNALLSQNERAYFAQNSDQVSHLYRVLQSTAIDHTTGVAKDGSLRSIEVSIPMTLQAEVTLDPSHPSGAVLQNLPLDKWLAQACTLVCGLGAKRHRGLGQVTVTVDPENNK